MSTVAIRSVANVEILPCRKTFRLVAIALIFADCTVQPENYGDVTSDVSGAIESSARTVSFITADALFRASLAMK